MMVPIKAFLYQIKNISMYILERAMCLVVFSPRHSQISCYRCVKVFRRMMMCVASIIIILLSLARSRVLTSTLDFRYATAGVVVHDDVSSETHRDQITLKFPELWHQLPIVVQTTRTALRALENCKMIAPYV